MSDHRLFVVTYHYVRNVPEGQRAGIKALPPAGFRSQVDGLRNALEMASPESALAFLAGKYQPKRDLCLLTFDDGLREHADYVTPILAEHHIQAIFFVITSCLEEGCVAPVHMNHALTAELGFGAYSRLFLDALNRAAPHALESAPVDASIAQRTYPWDDRPTASFKYFFNFVLDAAVRDQVVGNLFVHHLGGQKQFAQGLYISWSSACEMQSSGMVIGGHSHRHRPLARLTQNELVSDLTVSRDLLRTRLGPQTLWPFSYPYGKRSSYNASAISQLQTLGFDCAFSTEEGSNEPGVNLFEIRRLDTKKAPVPTDDGRVGVSHAT